jgi:BlaI family transcriptional regulator, penicillinase repressor
MADSQRAAVSDAELEVLKVLWEHGPRTVREVLELAAGQGRQWSRSTVITLLQRLERKGYVTSDQRSHVFVFHAAVTREDLARLRMEELAEELYEGDKAPLMLAFAQKHRFSADEIEQLRAVIDAWDSKRKRRHSGK